MIINYTEMSTPVSVFPNDVSMNNRLFVGGDISANGNLAVANNSTFNTADFNGSTNFKNFVTYDSFMISNATNQFAGTSTFSGPVNMSGTFIGANANFSGISSFGKKATFQSDAQVNRDLAVTGNTTLTKNVSIAQGDLNVVKNATINGTTTLNDVSINGVVDVSGNATFKNDVSIGGSLIANYPNASIPMTAISGLSSGLSTFNTDITMNEGLIVEKDVSMNGDVNIAGNLRATYPNASIPATAIDGLSVITEDLSLNKGL